MVSGRETLADIDQAVTKARNAIASLESQIETVNGKLGAMRQAQTQDYKDLARVRLGLIAESETVRQLDRAEQQVVALLAQRHAALQDLDRQMEAADAALRALEGERSRQAERVNVAAEAVDAAEAKTQAAARRGSGLPGPAGAGPGGRAGRPARRREGQPQRGGA